MSGHMAQIKKVQGLFSWVVILSECSHVFCCVLPSIFSIVTLLVGVGMIGAMPIWMDGLHQMMHGYEIPLMMASGVVVMLGWGLNYLSNKIDCHDTGCGHGACKPKKKKSERILMAATVLFLINISIYMVVHQDIAGVFEGAVTQEAAHHDHDGHDH